MQLIEPAVVPDINQLVRDDRVHRSIYADPAIFEAEMTRIFDRTWVYVAHESELLRSGDFKLAQLGRQPAIVTRLADGRLCVLLNRCTHRGATICREPRGNSAIFRCPYHGWTFKNDGALIGITRRQRYPADDDLHALDAVRAPRVESYRGFVFASMNPDVEPLVAYLAQARRWLDRQIDLALDGTVSLDGGVHRHVYRGNWKFQAENGVDGYHAVFLHESFFTLQKAGQIEGGGFGPRDESLGFTMAFDNGHALLGRHLPPEQRAAARAAAPEYFAALDRTRGAARVDELLTQMNLFIFPNLYVLLNQVRVITPVSLTETHVTISPFTLDGASAELNERRLREHEIAFAPTGFVGPDDYAAFDAVTDGLRAHAVPWFILRRGIHDERIEPDGALLASGSDETPQRGIYRRYRALMSEAR